MILTTATIHQLDDELDDPRTRPEAIVDLDAELSIGAAFEVCAIFRRNDVVDYDDVCSCGWSADDHHADDEVSAARRARPAARVVVPPVRRAS